MRATPRASPRGARPGDGSAPRSRSHRSPAPPRTPAQPHADWSLSLAVPAVPAPPPAPFSFSPQLLARLQEGAAAIQSSPQTRGSSRRGASPQATRSQQQRDRQRAQPPFASTHNQLTWQDRDASPSPGDFAKSAADRASSPSHSHSTLAPLSSGQSTLRVHPADMQSLLHTLRQIDPRGDHTFVEEIADRVQEHGALALRMRSPPRIPQARSPAAAWPSSFDSRVSATPSQTSGAAAAAATVAAAAGAAYNGIDETVPFSQTQPPWFLAGARAIAHALEEETANDDGEDVALFSQTQPPPHQHHSPAPASAHAVVGDDFDPSEYYAPPTQLSPPTRAFEQMQLRQHPQQQQDQQQSPVVPSAIIPESDQRPSGSDIGASASGASVSVSRRTFHTGASASTTTSAGAAGGFFNPFAWGAGFTTSFETQAPEEHDHEHSDLSGAPSSGAAASSSARAGRRSLGHDEDAILAESTHAHFASRASAHAEAPANQGSELDGEDDWLMRAAQDALAPTDAASSPAAQKSALSPHVGGAGAVFSLPHRSDPSLTAHSALDVSMDEQDAARSPLRRAESREYSASPPSHRASPAPAAAAFTAAGVAGNDDSMRDSPASRSRSLSRSHTPSASGLYGDDDCGRAAMDEHEASLDLSWTGGQQNQEQASPAASPAAATPVQRRLRERGSEPRAPVALVPPSFGPGDTGTQLTPLPLERSIDFGFSDDAHMSPVATPQPRSDRRLSAAEDGSPSRSTPTPLTPPLTQMSREEEEEDGREDDRRRSYSSPLILTSKDSQDSSDALGMHRLGIRSPPQGPVVPRDDALYSDTPASPNQLEHEHADGDAEDDDAAFERHDDEAAHEEDDGLNSSATASLDPPADPEADDRQAQSEEEHELLDEQREEEADQDDALDAEHGADDDDEVIEVDPAAQAPQTAEGWRLRKAASAAAAGTTPPAQPKPKPFQAAQLARSQSLAAAAESAGPPSLRRAHSAAAAGGPATPGVPWKRSKVHAASSESGPTTGSVRVAFGRVVSSPSTPTAPSPSPQSSHSRRSSGSGSVAGASVPSSPGLGVIDSPSPSQIRSVRRSARPTLVQPVFGSRAAAVAGSAKAGSATTAGSAAASKARAATSGRTASRPAAPPIVDPAQPASALSRPVAAKGSRIAPLTLTNYLRAPVCISSPPPQQTSAITRTGAAGRAGSAAGSGSGGSGSGSGSQSGSLSQSRREEIDLTSPPRASAADSGSNGAGSGGRSGAGVAAALSSPSRIPVYSPFKRRSASSSSASVAGNGK